MTFIELVRAVRSRVGMQGTGPASIAGAVGAEVDLVNVVSDAYSDIQNSRENWLWLRDQVSFSTQLGVETYTPTTIFLSGSNRLNRWINTSLYFVDGTVNKKIFNYLPYDNFVYLFANESTTSKPNTFTIRPQDDALIFNSPNGAYTVTIDYWKKPQVLTTDNSIPEMPPQFHLVIVYEAIAKYCAAVSSPELYDKYAYDHTKLYGALQRRFLPKKEVNIIGLA